MTDPRAQRAALTVCLVFVFLPGLLLLGQRPGSASFVITVATLLLGATVSALVLATVVISARKAGSVGGTNSVRNSGSAGRSSKDELRSGHE